MAFATARLAAGATAVRGMIAQAWEESADTPIGYPMINVRDIESGKARATRAMFGADQVAAINSRLRHKSQRSGVRVLGRVLHIQVCDVAGCGILTAASQGQRRFGGIGTSLQGRLFPNTPLAPLNLHPLCTRWADF